MAKDATTFFVFFLKIESLLNKYDRLAHKIYFWTPEVQRSAAVIVKNKCATKLQRKSVHAIVP